MWMACVRFAGVCRVADVSMSLTTTTMLRGSTWGALCAARAWMVMATRTPRRGAASTAERGSFRSMCLCASGCLGLFSVVLVL